MAVDFTRISADVAQIAAFVPQLQASLAAATAANEDPAVQTHLDALASTLEGLMPATAAVAAAAAAPAPTPSPVTTVPATPVAMTSDGTTPAAPAGTTPAGV